MWREIENLADIHYGKSPNDVRQENGKYPIYGTSGRTGYANDYLFDGPAVVLGRKGTLDNPIYVEEKFWPIDTTYAVFPRENVHAKWLFYSLLNVDFKSFNAATGVPSLSRDDLKTHKINCPEPYEQKAISEVLDTVDEAIVATQAMLDKQDKIKDGLLQDLLIRGVDANGKLRPAYKDAPDLYKQSPLGFIPKEWDVQPIKAFCQVTTGSRDTQNKDDNGLYPFFVRSQKVEHINTYAFDGEGVLTAGDGVGTGKVFHYVNGKFDFHQRVYLMHSFNSEMMGRFFFEYFRSHFMRRVEAFSAKNTVDSVRMEMITNMDCPIPTISEQKKISELLLEHEVNKEELIRELNKLKTLKAGLMQDLLTGKKRISKNQREAA